MGSQVKSLSKNIVQMRKKFLRSVVVIDAISKGDIFSTKNIGIRRTLPGRGGCEPKHFDNILGLIANKDFCVNEPITIEVIH
jgi:sialic acid synthase SpsE